MAKYPSRCGSSPVSLLKILHCPTSTGGHPWGLSRAERRLGLESVSAVFSRDYLDYPCDLYLYDKKDPKIIQQAKCWRYLFHAARKFDIIHYNYGLGLLPWGFTERWVGKNNPGRHGFRLYTRICEFVERSLLGSKVIVVTFQGDDARQGDYCLQNFSLSIAHACPGVYYSPGQDQLNRKKILCFDEKADLIYALNPDLLRVLPRRARYLPYAHLCPREVVVAQKAVGSKPLIVHAPTHRQVKGTQHIIEAVSRLQREGISCELALVEKKHHRDAMKIYEQADLMVDQLWAGWYGGFAVEAMALGKPVIGYIRREDLSRIPESMARELPVIQATPDSIGQVLKEWLTIRKKDLSAWGLRGRAFIKKWHDPDRIADSVRQDYLGALQQKRNIRKTKLTP